jgi:hypothetical protein
LWWRGGTRSWDVKNTLPSLVHAKLLTVSFSFKAGVFKSVVITFSRAGLERAPDRIQRFHCRVVDLENGGRTTLGVITRLNEVVYTASQQLMNKQTGQKALILFTDGADRGSSAMLV